MFDTSEGILFKADPIAIQVADGWARFVNRNGRQDHGGYRPISDDELRFDPDLENYWLVESVLSEFGRPADLRRLLIYVHFFGRDISEFRLALPGEKLPVRIFGLGFRSESDLIEIAYLRVMSRLKTAVLEAEKLAQEDESEDPKGT